MFSTVNMNLLEKGIKMIPMEIRAGDSITVANRRYQVNRKHDQIEITRSYNNIMDTIGIEPLKQIVLGKAKFKNPGLEPVENMVIEIKREIRITAIVFLSILFLGSMYVGNSNLDNGLLCIGLVTLLGLVIVVLSRFAVREFSDDFNTDLKYILKTSNK